MPFRLGEGGLPGSGRIPAGARMPAVPAGRADSSLFMNFLLYASCIFLFLFQVSLAFLQDCMYNALHKIIDTAWRDPL
jgi:hypothetical protein